MKPEDIKVGSTYIGGKNATKRTVIGFGAHEGWIRCAKAESRLPYGGFTVIQITSRKAFAVCASK